MESMDTILKQTIQGEFGPKLVSFHPVVLEKIFKEKAMAVILDVGKGHRAQFWKRITQRVLFPSLVQFGPTGS